MTLVHIRLRAPTVGGTRPANGLIVFQPSARHSDKTTVTLPDTFTVVLDANGEATVDIQPNGAGWCWKADEQVPHGAVRWFNLPDSVATLEYADLTDVDPRTLKPGKHLAAWQAILDDINNKTGVLPRFRVGHGLPTDLNGGDVYLDIDTGNIYQKGN